MLERLKVRNFKRFAEAEIELGETVVFIGPNNAGKTTALQALALWELGVRRWREKRGGREAPEKRPGVTLNRRDLVALPVPDASGLWRGLHMREVVQDGDGRRRTVNIRIDIEVDGIADGRLWRCGLEFDYANPESLYCRPLRLDEEANRRMPVPDEAANVRVAYLPPMSGLAANETRLDPGAIQVRLGEGRTAEVLRNLCFQVLAGDHASDGWLTLKERIERLFGIELNPPEYIPERGEITMTYRDPGAGGVQLDLSAAGRGLQQTLLLLSYLQVNPGSVVLLDEPDAHLEILRQRQIYSTITEVARAHGCQVIAASHSEVLLNEAADRDIVIAFVGRPHRIDDRGAQVAKSLKAIGFEHYYQAEQKGWVLYLEGSTDLAILSAFAQRLGHPAAAALERPFVYYVQNQASRARDHFRGLLEAKGDLVGLLLVDRDDRLRPQAGPLRELMWSRREIENYLCFPEVLEAYAASLVERFGEGPLFEAARRQQLVERMRECIRDRVPLAALKDPTDQWWKTVKASDEFLDLVFRAFFSSLGLPGDLMRKTDYHQLARFVPSERIDEEVVSVLDQIAEVAAMASPLPTIP